MAGLQECDRRRSCIRGNCPHSCGDDESEQAVAAARGSSLIGYTRGKGIMPHDGLIVETKLGPVAGPRQRARLHLRSGKRRLRQGKTAAGIVTLYDAVTAAMEACAASGERHLSVRPGENISNEKALYRVLVRSGVLDGYFDFEAFDRLVEKALSGNMDPFDYGPIVSGIEAVLTQLGVVPFDEGGLPPEDPRTF